MFGWQLLMWFFTFSDALLKAFSFSLYSIMYTWTPFLHSWVNTLSILVCSKSSFGLLR